MTLIKSIQSQYQCKIQKDPEAIAKREQQKFENQMDLIVSHQNSNMIVVQSCTRGVVKRQKKLTKTRPIRKTNRKSSHFAIPLDISVAVHLCEL